MVGVKPMPTADLVLANPDIALSVRTFSIKDGLSQLFDVEVTASSPIADLDLEPIVGRGASLRLATADPEAPYALWAGICNDIEQPRVSTSVRSRPRQQSARRMAH